jgi:predicted Zn-ribbon and HTH transcriptional regulator
MRTRDKGTAALLTINLEGEEELMCEGCGYTGIEDTEIGEPLYCPSCEGELFYRPWFQW